MKRGTPPEIVAKLHASVVTALKSPDVIEKLGVPVYAGLPYSPSQEQLNRRRKASDGKTRLLTAEEREQQIARNEQAEAANCSAQ